MQIEPDSAGKNAGKGAIKWHCTGGSLMTAGVREAAATSFTGIPGVEVA
jgi:hypothetical protein